MRFSDWRRAASLFVALSLLSGCGFTFGDNESIGPPPPCPRIVKVGDAITLTRFQGASRDVKDVAFQAQVGEVASGCSYISEESKTRITMVMRVQTIASRGPALEGDNAEFQYWVAVARIDGTILNRDAFDVEIELAGNVTRAQSVDELEQNIFLRSGEAGDNYVVYVGLVLTPDEVAYNRGQTEPAAADQPAPAP
jgi:hypothetical protein